MDNRSNQVFYTPTQKAAPAVADLSSFYRTYEDQALDTNASSGSNIVVLSGTPSGVVRVVIAIMGFNSTNAVDVIYLITVINNNIGRITNITNPLAYECADFSGQVVLDENDYIRADFNGCTTGDTLRLSAVGYDVKKY